MESKIKNQVFQAFSRFTLCEQVSIQVQAFKEVENLFFLLYVIVKAKLFWKQTSR